MKVIKWIVNVAGIVFLLSCVLTPIGVYYNVSNTTSGVVTDKYVKDQKYYVVVGDNVYKNQDDLFVGKHNSADIQAKMKVGDEVTVKTVGYRNEIFSVFPNVTEVMKNDK